MHRTITTAAAALPLLALGATLSPTVAGAVEPRKTTRTITLTTDAMPTRVTGTVVAGRMSCVKVTAGAGRDRRVWLSLDGEPPASDYVRVKPRTTTGCLLTGESAPRGTRLSILVEEDVLGPFNPRDRGTLTF